MPETRVTSSPLRPASSRRSGWLLWSGVAVATVVLLVVAVLVGVNSAQASHEVEPGINRTSATLLQLDNIRSDKLTAPGYSLTDQRGRPMTAAEFRGRSVVLTFNDDRCEDLCTLLAQDIAKADHDLGRAAKHVAFVSINANPYYPRVSDVKAWSDQHGLRDLFNWYFGTGAPATLSASWKKYGVPVELDAKTRSIEHGSEIFFIDPSGREVALGQFGTESADTAPFAHAMAQMAVDLLPSGERSTVAGPSLPAPTHGGTEIGATPSPTKLPSLRDPGETISTGSGRGTFTVLNFWASTCTACVQELPALERAHRDLGTSVTFLGVDVSDTSRAGLAFARRAGVTYPLASDAQGSVSGQYRITGLPFTVVLNPKGKVVIRHAGAFTAQQLDYIVQTLEPRSAG